MSYPISKARRSGASPTATHQSLTFTQHLPPVCSVPPGYFECDKRVKVGRPKDVEELKALVGMYPKVKGVGVGHSWWKESFCAGSDANALNIVTTELQATLDL